MDGLPEAGGPPRRRWARLAFGQLCGPAGQACRSGQGLTAELVEWWELPCLRRSLPGKSVQAAHKHQHRQTGGRRVAASSTRTRARQGWARRCRCSRAWQEAAGRRQVVLTALGQTGHARWQGASRLAWCPSQAIAAQAPPAGAPKDQPLQAGRARVLAQARHRSGGTASAGARGAGALWQVHCKCLLVSPPQDSVHSAHSLWPGCCHPYVSGLGALQDLQWPLGPPLHAPVSEKNAPSARRPAASAAAAGWSVLGTSAQAAVREATMAAVATGPSHGLPWSPCALPAPRRAHEVVLVTSRWSVSPAAPSSPLSRAPAQASSSLSLPRGSQAECCVVTVRLAFHTAAAQAGHPWARLAAHTARHSKLRQRRRGHHAACAPSLTPCTPCAGSCGAAQRSDRQRRPAASAKRQGRGAGRGQAACLRCCT